MTALPRASMSVEEFIAWAERKPERWELFDGVPVAMSPERVVHGDVKYRVARPLDGAIAKTGVPRRFVLDSAAVRIDAKNLFQPDALVYCGAKLASDAVEVPSPIIVVEVLSPSTRHIDASSKLAGYFKVPSVHHYLIVDPERRLVIQHSRGAGDLIGTRILSRGTLDLLPPGITLALARLFSRPADRGRDAS